MKTRYITVWCMLAACLIQAQSFKQVKGLAKDISIDKTGRVFIIETTNNQAIFNTKRGAFVRFNGTPAASGSAVSYSNNPYRNQGGSSGSRQHPHDRLLDLLQGQKHKDVCLSKGGTIWMIKSDGRVYYETTSGLKYAYKGGTNNKRIAVIDGNRFYTVKNDNSIWEYQNGRGTKMSGAALDISFDHNKNKLYVIGVSYRVFIRNTIKNRWDVIKGTRTDFKQLSVKNGMIWAVANNRKVYSNDINGAVYNYLSATGNDVYKLKVTLEYIYCDKAWDNDKKDDYMLSFNPSIKVHNKNIPMKDRKLNRIGRLIEGFGGSNSLYVKFNSNTRNHAKVQLHTNEKKSVQINNSGVFEIPKNIKVARSHELEVITRVDEVSDQTVSIINSNEKLNLKELVNYLGGDKILNKYKEVRRVNNSGTNGSAQWRGQSIYYDMGRGYKPLNLTTRSGRKVAYATISGSKSKSAWGGTKYTKPSIRYRFELID